MIQEGGPHITNGYNLASHPAAPGLILFVHMNLLFMLLRFIDSTAWNSEKTLENVNPTHLVLTSGKLVLGIMLDNLIHSIPMDLSSKQMILSMAFYKGRFLHEIEPMEAPPWQKLEVSMEFGVKVITLSQS